MTKITHVAPLSPSVKSSPQELGQRPVGRALFPSCSWEMACSAPPVIIVVDDQLAFSPKKTKKKCVNKKDPPIVESLLHRCTRSAAKRDGFKLVFQQFPPVEPHKKKPRQNLSL
ncbi:hypothetical protein D1007_27829 [Hordeum vulgare]|nr:hypothetical protein D1007_27829 [Hordeum vulgare]